MAGSEQGTAPVAARLEGASRIYNAGEDTEVRAMDRVDLTIERGDFLALVGPSGSGKSTALNCIGCLDKPTSGRVLIDGQDTSVLDSAGLSRLRNERIGFIFQSFNLIPVFSAYENIEFALQIRGGIPPKEMHRRVMDMLEIQRQVDQKDRVPAHLSGGQQQRVAIGRALVKEPALVLADEPTANLDRKTSDEIIALMRRLNQELSVTFVMSTHDHHLMTFVRRMITLEDGRIVRDEQTGAKEEADA